MNKIIKNSHIFDTKTLKKASLLRKFAATGILSAIIVGLCGSNLAFAEIGGGDANFSYDGYSARQIKDIANCISKVDTITSLCSERGSQGWHDWAEQNLHNDTRGQFTMRGDTVQIRLVGVKVDNRADGKGKAGLTFMTTAYVDGYVNMADTDHNIGGYRDVRVRKDYNEEQYKNTISNDVYQFLTPVLKTQDNQANEEMNNRWHSATSNAIVEKVSMPSPLELNMNVTNFNSNGYKNGFTPSGLVQYNPYSWWQGLYNYLYSGNAPYEYYQNNTSDVSEYCKLVRGSGEFNTGKTSDPNTDSCKTGQDYISVWFRSAWKTSDAFGEFGNLYGAISGDNASDAYHYYINAYRSYSIILLSF